MDNNTNYLNDPELYQEASEILKALAHPVRLCIVSGLIRMEGSNVTNIQNCLNMPQSTISQHLAKLRTSGIITGHRNGLEITYKVSNPKVIEIINGLLN